VHLILVVITRMYMKLSCGFERSQLDSLIVTYIDVPIPCTKLLGYCKSMTSPFPGIEQSSFTDTYHLLSDWGNFHLIFIFPYQRKLPSYICISELEGFTPHYWKVGFRFITDAGSTILKIMV